MGVQQENPKQQSQHWGGKGSFESFIALPPGYALFQSIILEKNSSPGSRGEKQGGVGGNIALVLEACADLICICRKMYM